MTFNTLKGQAVFDDLNKKFTEMRQNIANSKTAPSSLLELAQIKMVLLQMYQNILITAQQVDNNQAYLEHALDSQKTEDRFLPN